MKRLVIWAVVCSAVFSNTLCGQSESASAAREAENLRAIAGEPGHRVVLALSDGAPFKEHLALFDQAFAACRRALRANPEDMSVRANLGALYLWRGAFYP